MGAGASASLAVNVGRASEEELREALAGISSDMKDKLLAAISELSPEPAASASSEKVIIGYAVHTGEGRRYTEECRSSLEGVDVFQTTISCIRRMLVEKHFEEPWAAEFDKFLYRVVRKVRKPHFSPVSGQQDGFTGGEKVLEGIAEDQKLSDWPAFEEGEEPDIFWALIEFFGTTPANWFLDTKYDARPEAPDTTNLGDDYSTSSLWKDYEKRLGLWQKAQSLRKENSLQQ
eukprot:TRINITY_DN69567_c0_g1_i1.p1 TRINITY_DN69567_c0_g1~~TRINITY_DN69567_c0_g1_i1.p1  ORF type:complete len:249 (+),score=49.15 TRINITY_DN69567_c0_g1_i1:52-747(+)